MTIFMFSHSTLNNILGNGHCGKILFEYLLCGCFLYTVNSRNCELTSLTENVHHFKFVYVFDY